MVKGCCRKEYIGKKKCFESLCDLHIIAVAFSIKKLKYTCVERKNLPKNLRSDIIHLVLEGIIRSSPKKISFLKRRATT